jgi:hypothetical protein
VLTMKEVTRNFLYIRLSNAKRWSRHSLAGRFSSTHKLEANCDVVHPGYFDSFSARYPSLCSLLPIATIDASGRDSNWKQSNRRTQFINPKVDSSQFTSTQHPK